MKRNALSMALLVVSSVFCIVKAEQHANLTLNRVTDQLCSQYYDQNRVVGGLFKQLASLFVEVKRGTLTPEGFRFLEAWMQDKSAATLGEYLKTVRDSLRSSALSTTERDVLQAMKTCLYFAHKEKEEEDN